MNKNCSDIEIAISEMILGDVSKETETEVHSHIATCQDCMGFYLSMAETFGPQSDRAVEGLSSEQKMKIFTTAKELDEEKVCTPAIPKKFPWNIVLSVAAAVVVSGIVLMPVLTEEQTEAVASFQLSKKDAFMEASDKPVLTSVKIEEVEEVLVDQEKVEKEYKGASVRQRRSKRSVPDDFLNIQDEFAASAPEEKKVNGSLLSLSADDDAFSDLDDVEQADDAPFRSLSFSDRSEDQKEGVIGFDSETNSDTSNVSVFYSLDLNESVDLVGGEPEVSPSAISKKKQKVVAEVDASAKKDLARIAAVDKLVNQQTLNTAGQPNERRAMQDAKLNQQSTFSIDVDTAGYQIARTQIINNINPDPQVLRAEEFINYQNYNYQAPQQKTFNIESSMAESPFHRGSQIMHIGIQGRRPGGDHRSPSHFCFIVDTSGSMAAEGRLPLIKKVLPMIVKQMNPGDKVSLLAGGLKPKLILDKVDVSDLNEINQKVSSLNAVGATNLEANLVEGYTQVENIQPANTYNRVVLMSDGVANLGEVSAQNILKRLEVSREKGVGITVIGMGQGEYNDNFLEQLANKGDGNYVYIDDSAEAQKTFEEKFASTFHTIAKNVKIQVDFDPEQVARYRLLGYENRRLKNEDFRNDNVDAGEVGSGQSVTAIYELELTGEARQAPLATVNMRYQDVRDNKMKEQNLKIQKQRKNTQFSQASSALRLAFLAGKYAEVLQQGGRDEGITVNHLLKYMRPLAAELNNDGNVQEMLQLMNKSK